MERIDAHIEREQELDEEEVNDTCFDCVGGYTFEDDYPQAVTVVCGFCNGTKKVELETVTCPWCDHQYLYNPTGRSIGHCPLCWGERFRIPLVAREARSHIVLQIQTASSMVCIYENSPPPFMNEEDRQHARAGAMKDREEWKDFLLLFDQLVANQRKG